MLTALVPLETGRAIDAAIIDAAQRAMSPNTWRARRADLRLMTLPALPATVAQFLRDQAEHGKKAATLARYTASIARLHAMADQPDTTRAELVRLEL